MKKLLILTLVILNSSAALYSAGALRRSAVRAGAVAALSAAAAAHRATDYRTDGDASLGLRAPPTRSGSRSLERFITGVMIPGSLLIPGSDEWKEHYYIAEKQKAMELVEAFKKRHSEADLKAAIAFFKELYKKLKDRKDPSVMDVAAANELAALTEPVLRIYGWQTFIDSKLLDEAFDLALPMSPDGWVYSSSRATALLAGFRWVASLACAKEAMLIVEKKSYYSYSLPSCPEDLPASLIEFHKHLGASLDAEWGRDSFVKFLKLFIAVLDQKNERLAPALSDDRLFSYFERQAALEKSHVLQDLTVRAYKALLICKAWDNSKELK